MGQHEHTDIFPSNYDNSFGALIGKASKTFNDMKFCKKAKTIIIVDIWLNSSKILIQPLSEMKSPNNHKPSGYLFTAS